MAESSLGDLPRESRVIVGLISASEFLNHTYLTLLPPVLGVLALDFDVSLAALGAAIGLQSFINVCLQLPYGYVTDNYDRSLTLGACLSVSALGTLVLSVAPTFTWLLVGQALLGVGIAGHHPAHYPLLSDATPERYRGRVFSVFGFFGNLGFGAPAALYVAVTAVTGYTWRHTFALVGVLGLGFAAFTVYVLRVHVPASVRRPNVTESSAVDGGSGVRARIGYELRSTIRSPLILAMAALAMLFSAAIWGVASFLVTLLEQGYGVPSGTASLALTAAFGAGAAYKLIGGALADRIGPVPVVIASAVLASATCLVLASLVIPPIWAIAAAILGGNVVSFAVPARDKLTDLLSTRDEIGRNFAIITIGVMIGNTIAPPTFGLIIDEAGYRVGFVAIALAGIAIVGMVASMSYRWRDELIRETPT